MGDHLLSLLAGTHRNIFLQPREEMNKHKRNIIALACFCGVFNAAQAQSSVVLYGLIDVNMTHVNYGEKLGGSSKWSMTDGTVNGLYGSRWGIRSTEDLGGGLKVQAVLESGFGVDTGSSFQGGRLMGRQAYVSLSSSNLGEVRFGRQYTPTDFINGGISAPLNGLANNPSLPVTTSKGLLPQWVTPGRLDNILQYISPKFSGFDFSLLAAPGEGVNDRYQAVRIGYVAGSLTTGAAYEWNKDKSTGESTNKLASVAAAYNFGSFKLTGGIQRADDLTTSPGNAGAINSLIVTGPTNFVATRIETYNIGFAIPITAQLTTGANYYQSKYSGVGQTAELGKVGLGATYALSKSTKLYTALTLSSRDLKEYIQEKNVFQVGMNTMF